MFGKYAWSHILIVSAILDGKLSSNLSLKYSFHLARKVVVRVIDRSQSFDCFV